MDAIGLGTRCAWRGRTAELLRATIAPQFGAVKMNTIQRCSLSYGAMTLLAAAMAFAGAPFAIGLEEVASDGAPGPGAGNIEVAGGTHDYTFTVASGTAWGTPDADLSGDGTTGFADLVLLLNDWD